MHRRMPYLHDGVLGAAVADGGVGSCKIIFSHRSQVNTSTSGSPLRAGKDSKRRNSPPQDGQIRKVLSNVTMTKLIVSHNSNRNKICLCVVAPMLFGSKRPIGAESARIWQTSPTGRRRACGEISVASLTSPVRSIIKFGLLDISCYLSPAISSAAAADRRHQCNFFWSDLS
jgi:hypothetical protein